MTRFQVDVVSASNLEIYTTAVSLSQVKGRDLKEKVVSESLCIKTLEVICRLDEGYCIIDRNAIFFIKTHMATNILLQCHYHNRTIHYKVLDFLSSLSAVKSSHLKALRSKFGFYT